jgi:tetratricopeptide (TPR) repeat protein
MRRSILTIISFLVLFTSSSAQVEERDRGIELYEAGKYDEAAAVLQAVVDKEPANKVAWTYLGGALMNLNRKDEALAAFRKPMGGPPLPKVEKSVKILKKDPAPYTELARDNNVKGTIVVVVELKADGKIGFVVPIKELGFGLTENAIRSAKTTKFEPAVRNGKPVTQIRMMSYSFETY